MMRLLNAMTVLSMVMLLSGCVRTSHKLSEVGETVTDDTIVGVWELQHDSLFGPTSLRENKRIRIESCADGSYQMRDVKPGENGDLITPFCLVKAAGGNFVEVNYYKMACLSEPTLSDADKQKLANEPGTLFPFRWERRGDWIAVWTANRSKINQHLNKDELIGESWGGIFGLTAITSTAADLETFIARHGDEIFDSRQVYKRISSDDSTPAGQPNESN
jgi:hypothetical protein